MHTIFYDVATIGINALAQEFADLLEEQLRGTESGGLVEGSHEDLVLGRHFSLSELDLMSEQQLTQLLELRRETSKPRPERTDSH